MRFPVMISRLALGAMIALTACSAAAPDAPGPETELPAEVTIVVTDTAFQVPAGLEAEPVTITLRNEAEAAHTAFFARLNEGVSSQKVRQTFRKNPDAVLGLVTVAGALPRTKPGGTTEATIQFPEGSYLAVDPESKGPPPIGFFEVSAASGPRVQAPEASFVIDAGEFFFKIDRPVAGQTMVRVTNVGKQSHEVIIFKKGADREAFFTLAPAPGGSLWTTIDLEPGTYQVICHFPDPKTGKPHAKLGMKTTLTIE